MSERQSLLIYWRENCPHSRRHKLLVKILILNNKDVMEQSLFALVTTDPSFYRPTPAWGQSRHFDRGLATSGLLRTTDIIRAGRHVSNEPISAVEQRSRCAALVRVAVGTIGLGFTTAHWLGFQTKTRRRAPGIFWGTVAGFTGTLANAGGPPFLVYAMSQNLPKMTFVGTMAIFFLCLNATKLIPFFELGQLSYQTLELSFAPLPFANTRQLCRHSASSWDCFFRLLSGFISARFRDFSRIAVAGFSHSMESSHERPSTSGVYAFSRRPFGSR